MTKQRIKYLLDRYLKGSLSPKEQEEWTDIFHDSDLRIWLDELIDSVYDQLTEEELVGLTPDRADKMFASMTKVGESPHVKGTIKTLLRRLAVAASIMLCLSAAAYIMLHSTNKPQNKIANNKRKGIKPGTYGAILTLANGHRITLEQKKVGLISQQNGIRATKAGDSSLVYQAGQGTTTIADNTLETPRGRQYLVVLPDGTKVWLNAGSSITYPIAFTGKVRSVKLTGEAYFAVVHNARRPFFVDANGQTVQDVGTEFNVNAYRDEPTVITTLVKGSVKVIHGQNSQILSPGQQSMLDRANGQMQVQKADLEQALAWKNGNFVFEHDSIASIMRKVSRWYDVDVVYPNGIPNVELGGTISRFSSVADLLDVLQSTGAVHFKIEGGRIIVIK
jgi:transmembrane sensor